MPKGMPRLPPTPSQVAALGRLHEAGYVGIKDLTPPSRDAATAAISAAVEKYKEEFIDDALKEPWDEFEFALDNGERAWIGGPRPWGCDGW